MPVSVGEKLGPYEILAPIGAGGMGEVWKARDTRLDRIVAIKQLKRDYAERFAREARAIAALNHPHICQIHDVGPDYLVMEYVEGKPLRGPLPADKALHIAIQIAGALEAAHKRGILHRDLKPGNLLVTESGVKLLDFGLAKITQPGPDDLTAQSIEGAVLGTPAYMAPEQAQGKPVDERSDMFSFGAVLYEMLSGRRAFAGDSLGDILSAVIRDTPARLESPAASIVERCLAKQPAQRFRTMADVRAALEQCTAKPREKQPSIAVLPFVNMSTDKEQEFFSDGLAEEILNLLAKIPGLKVIARTSSFAFRGKEQDITKIAETLRVRTVLEGSVRRAGNRIRVTAQLISSEDGSHLWSERYDRELADVFAVQDEIASAIAGALQLKLGGPPARKHQPNLAAYEAHLKARHQIAKISPEGFERGREYCLQAIARDPEYGAPHADLATYYCNLAISSLRPPKEVMPLARASAARALELDPSEAEAHGVLGFVAAVYDYDWDEAEKQQRLARAGMPGGSDMALVSWVTLGRFEEAVRDAEAELAHDPLNVRPRNLLQAAWLHQGLYDTAIAEARRALEIDEHRWLTHYYLGCGYAWQGRFAEARGPLERSFQLAPWHPYTMGGLAGVLACLGEKDLADELTAKIPETGPIGWVVYHLLRSDIAAAADWYERVIELRSTSAPIWAHAAFLKPLRESQWWPRLAKMMNLPHGSR
jgi:eukaryotic-like serine/threonine-protein kinase